MEAVSSPVVGSSSSHKGFSAAATLAMASRRFCPAERNRTGKCANFSNPTSASPASGTCSARVRAGFTASWCPSQPIRAACASRSVSAGRLFQNKSPVAKGVSPARARSRLDFPAPFAPRRRRIPPWHNEKPILFRISRSPRKMERFLAVSRCEFLGAE